MAHKCIVAKIDRTVAIEGADRIHIAFVLGEQVIVSKDWQEGMVGLFFPVDLQLSEQYCKENNLFRDSTKNMDETKKGFFEASRRVRAQPFLKVKSTGYFASLDSLDYLGKVNLKLGDQFDELNGVLVCEKYISEKAKQKIANSSTKKVKLVEFPTFNKHVDSEQFKHFAERIEAGSILYFHAKVHGTSFRVGHLPRTITLPRWKEYVNRFVPVFKTEVMDHVVGTRNVIIENQDKEGFHGSEAFRFEVADILGTFIEPGMTIYGEIAGYANGRPIMPNHSVKALKDKRYTDKYGNENVYSYGCPEGQYRFHIYRITHQKLNGESVDMTQEQLEKWCDNRGLTRTVDVHPKMVYDGDVQKLRDLVEELTERPDVLTEDFINPQQIGEGIIIRVDNGKGTPDFYKSKSYAFRVMEGLAEADDMETMS